jgi:hypothetical protein
MRSYVDVALRGLQGAFCDVIVAAAAAAAVDIACSGSSHVCDRRCCCLLLPGAVLISPGSRENFFYQDLCLSARGPEVMWVCCGAGPGPGAAWWDLYHMVVGITAGDCLV